MPLAFNGIYAASKVVRIRYYCCSTNITQALECIADVLRVEVKAFGIDVIVMQPVCYQLIHKYVLFLLT